MQNSSDNNISTGSSKPMLPAGWNGLDVVPEDTEVEVIDADGNTAFAQPTYYPFIVGERTGGKWTNKITPCEPYWDGGWLIGCVGLDCPVGDVVGWRYRQPACR